MCPDLFIASAVDAGCPQVLQLWVRRSSPVLPGISDQPPEVTPFPVIPTQGPACWEALSGVWVGTSMESMAPVSLLNFEDLNTLGHWAQMYVCVGVCVCDLHAGKCTCL